MNLPKKYEWLAHEGAPRHLLKALELYGVEEVVGPKHNPVIMGWAKELGITYNNDETPWCGLFMAIIMKRAERQVVEWPLGARNWTSFGIPSLSPMLGDVLIFKRPNGGGHVGLYVGEDTNNFYVLGGNQGNQVSIVKIVKSRLLAARRPPYFNPPTNIRKIYLKIDGKPSENEA
jgi:hypothetical protein